MGEVTEFDSWLNDRLRELKTDENVFGPYIKSILEGDEDAEEKIDALDGLLVELQANLDVVTIREEILSRWHNAQTLVGDTGNRTSSYGGADPEGASALTNSTTSSVLNKKSDCNGTESLANHMEHFMKLAGLDGESQSSSSTNNTGADQNAKSKGDIGADSALRAAILSQYCANDSSDDEETEGNPTKSKEGITKNQNAEKVLAEQRELKEKARAEHSKKKDRDKEDRAKQKQAAQDRKEKAKKKAQKGERKR